MNLWVPWTDARIEQLLKLTREGQSALQIACAMGGGITRNAVIGKWHRMGKQGHHIIKPPKREAPAKPVEIKQAWLSEKPATPKLSLDVSLANIHFTDRGRTYNKCAPSKFAPASAKASAGRPLKEPEPLRVTLMELSGKTCKWPIGDVGAADFCFCGHLPAPRLRETGPNPPYCEYHTRRSIAPPQDRHIRKFG